MDLDKLKTANQIFESLAEKSTDEALQELNTYDHLDREVLHLIKSLIKNSSQSNTYFNQKFEQRYQSTIHHQWQPGDEIGGYVLHELIGLGGMSMVFKAQRIDSDTQKPVAIKIFNLPNQNPEIREKFLAEQQILAQLSHPNIIDFHHGENTKQGDSFLVMELIRGSVSIEKYANNNNLDTHAIINLITQAAAALQHAHNNLIIHRDIKPSNMLIDDNGQLKVLDFGIAKLIDAENNLLKSAPKDTLLALTPSFAAPEQINNEPINITADVFSLAAVAINLLTGELPFPANRLLKSCVEDESHVKHLLFQHIKDQDLRNVLLQALKPDPRQRYPNMFAFRADLQAWLAQKPVTATKDTWWYRLRCFAQRRTALFVTSVVLGVTVIAAVAGLSHQNQAIKHEATKAEAVKNFMLNAFSVTDPNYSQGVDISAKDLLQVAAEKITSDKGMDEDIKFELNLAMGLANGRLGFYPEAIDLLKTALNFKPQDEQAIALLAQYQFNAGQIESLNELLANTQENLFVSNEQKTAVKRIRANVLAQAGQHESAMKMYEQLATMNHQPAEVFKNKTLLAEIHYLNGNSAKSIEILEQLKKDQPLAKTDVMSLGLNADLVHYYDRVGDFSAAMALTQENIKTFKTILGDEHPDLGVAYNALSLFQRLDGQLNKAISSAKESESIYRQRYGDSSEGLAQALSNLGVAHFYLQEHDLAIEHLTVAADMLAGIFGAEHPETMNAQFNLATILNATNNPAKALPILQSNYDYEVKTLGKENRSTLYTQRSLALTLGNLGRFEAALSHAKENIKLIHENHPDQTVNIINAYSVLGRIHFMAGNYQQAIEHTQKYLQNWSEGNKNNYAGALKLVAQSYLEIEQYEDAVIFYQKWTTQLEDLYGQTDIKYLQGLLESAEKSQQMNRNENAKAILALLQSILTDNDLELPEIKIRLNELSN